MEHAWAAGAAAIGDSGAAAKGVARNTQPHDRAAAAGGTTAGGNGRGKDAVSFLGGDDGHGGKGAANPAGNGAGNAAVPLRAFPSRNRKNAGSGLFYRRRGLSGGRVYAAGCRQAWAGAFAVYSSAAGAARCRKGGLSRLAEKQRYYTGRAAGQRENHRTAGFVQDDLGGRAGRPLPHGADR